MISKPSTGHAERRQITIAFVDLAGSTELSSHLDPEDFRNLILAYQEAVKSVIDQHDGYIARARSPNPSATRKPSDMSAWA